MYHIIEELIMIGIIEILELHNEEYIKNNILSCKSNIKNMSEMLTTK